MSFDDSTTHVWLCYWLTSRMSQTKPAQNTLKVSTKTKPLHKVWQVALSIVLLALVLAYVCNGITRAKRKRWTENAEPNKGFTNKPGKGAWSVIVTNVSSLHAHEGKPSMRWPTSSKAISRLFPRPYPNLFTSKFQGIGKYSGWSNETV